MTIKEAPFRFEQNLVSNPRQYYPKSGALTTWPRCALFDFSKRVIEDTQPMKCIESKAFVNTSKIVEKYESN